MYIHRIGRTGRAERSGEAVTFVTGEDTAMVKAVERLLGKPIERKTVQGFDYSVPAPKKDEEFKRPPREQQQRRNTGTARKDAAQGTAVTQADTAKEKAPGRPQRQAGQPKFAASPPKQDGRSRQGR
jgi:ATP-dependent RNA helicase RhlE